MADNKTQIIISAKDETLQAFNSVRRNLDGLNKATSGINLGGLTGGFLGFGVTGAAVAVLNKVINETKNAAAAQAQLGAVLRSTGNAAGFAQDELNKMATELSQRSIFSDDEITSAQVRLLSYTGIVGKEFPRAMQAVIDTSARMGLSVEQSAEIIGRALDIPSQGLTALTRQGFRFTEAQKELVKQLEETGRTAEAQDIILKSIEASYGGAAEAAKNTLGGALANLSNQFNDLFELKDDGRLFTAVINDLAIGLEAINAAAKDVPFDYLDKLIPSYKKFREEQDKAIAAAKGPNNLLPRDARIDQSAPTLFNFPVMIKEGEAVKNLITQIQENGARFRQNNPLKDAVAKQEEYRKKLEEINKLEREGGLTAQEAGRYRKQLADTLNKPATNKDAEAADRFIEQLRKQAELLGKSSEETILYDAAQLKLTETQKKTLQGLLAQIRAFDQLTASTKAWAEQDRLNQDFDTRELDQLESDSADDQRALEERARNASNFYDELVRQNEDANIDLIKNDRERASAQIELDRKRALDSIDALQLEKDQIEILTKEINDLYDKKQTALVNSGEDGFARLKRAIEGFGQDSAEAIADFAFGAETDFKDMVESMLKEMAKLAIYKGVTQPIFDGISSFFSPGGGIGDFFGGLFGGGSTGSFIDGELIQGSVEDFLRNSLEPRASGGPVSGGKAYLVGERGPELYVPGTSGTIIPNDFVGGGQTNISINVDARGNGNASSDADARKIADMVSAAVRAEMINQRRNRGLLTT